MDTVGVTERTGVRAARLQAHDQPLRVEEVELPDPVEGEAYIELAFAGVNPVDRYTAMGRVAPDGPLPRTLGGEAAGYRDGEPVLVTGEGLGARRDGVWASAAVVPEAAVVPLPDGVDLQEAASMGIAGLTAWKVVVDIAQVGPGDRVLVLGAAGGVGLPIVGLAAARGARVWGQTGSAEKAEIIRQEGAAEVLVTGAQGLAEAARALEPTVVIDSLGGAFAPAAISVLQPHGRLALFGTSAGAEVQLDWQAVYRNNLKILGYAGLILGRDERRAGLELALAALAERDLRIRIDRVVPLGAVQEAFELLSDRAVVGKVVLDLRG